MICLPCQEHRHRMCEEGECECPRREQNYLEAARRDEELTLMLDRTAEWEMEDERLGGQR